MKIMSSPRGITLVEILLATVILVFVTTAIIQFYLSSVGLSEMAKEETLAMAQLINMVESIKCTPFTNIVTDFPNGTLNGAVNNPYSTVVGGYTLTDECIVVSYVNSNSDPLEIMVNVTWRDRRGQAKTKYLVTKRTG